MKIKFVKAENNINIPALMARIRTFPVPATIHFTSICKSSKTILLPLREKFSGKSATRRKRIESRLPEILAGRLR